MPFRYSKWFTSFSRTRSVRRRRLRRIAEGNRRFGRVLRFLLQHRFGRTLEIRFPPAAEKREGDERDRYRMRTHFNRSFHAPICSRTRSGAVPPKLLRERTEASSESTL